MCLCQSLFGCLYGFQKFACRRPDLDFIPVCFRFKNELAAWIAYFGRVACCFRVVHQLARGIPDLPPNSWRSSLCQACQSQYDGQNQYDFFHFGSPSSLKYLRPLESAATHSVIHGAHINLIPVDQLASISTDSASHSILTSFLSLLRPPFFEFRQPGYVPARYLD